MTHRIPIKLQLPGKSRLIYNSISSSLHPGYHEILKPNIHTSDESNKIISNWLPWILSYGAVMITQPCLSVPVVNIVIRIVCNGKVF